MNKDSLSSWFKSLVAVTIAMISFWLLEARHYITRDEVAIMVTQSELSSKYNQDRAVIFDSLNTQKQNNDKLVIALKECTDAVTQLRISMAVLNKEKGDK